MNGKQCKAACCCVNNGYRKTTPASVAAHRTGTRTIFVLPGDTHYVHDADAWLREALPPRRMVAGTERIATASHV